MLKRFLLLIVLLVLSPLGMAQTVMITEFMADNLTSNFRDEDGERHDWLELTNMSTAPVSLNGWYLTDNSSDLRKWRFPTTAPAVTLAAGARIQIWCSEKNRKANATRLHTNFKLDKDGEYLALVRPDGVTVEHSFGPQYPPQFINGTYGVVVEYQTTILLPETAEGRAHVPQSQADYTTTMAGWNNTLNFDDSSWLAGPAGFGYSNTPAPGGTLFGNLIGTPVPGMLGFNASLCVRFKFDVADRTSVAAVRLRMKYDDGFACFLNGSRIGNGLAPSELFWDSTNLLQIPRQDSAAQTFELVSTPNALPALVQGTNLLAFQLLNTSKDDPDTVLRAQFEMDVATGLTTGYLVSATPGTVNSAQATAIGPAIDQVTKNPARPVGGAGSAPITVTAKVTPTLNPLAASNPVVLKWRRMHGTESAVNMTLNAATGLYTASVPTTSLLPGEMIRWRVEARDNEATPKYGYAPGFPFSATTPPSNPPPPNLTADLDQYYGTVAQDTITTSNVPILHWFAANPANADGTTGESCSLFFQPIPEFPPGTPDYLPPAPKFYDNVPIYRHGQSTSGGAFPQKSHNISFNKDNRFDWKDGEPAVRGVNLLTTWADKSKIRHALAYDTWEKSGHLASHFCQTVRVQLNGTFRGLYEMVEDGNEDFLDREGLDALGSLYKVYNSLENANQAVNNGGGSEKKNPDTSDFTDLQIFVNGINQSAMADRLRYAFDNVDIASTINFLAVHTLIMNRDFGHKNYYVYRDTASTGEWSPLPWDQDLSFGHTWTSAQNYFDDDIHSQGPLQLGTGNKLNQIVFGSPELNAMFVARVRTLADQFLVSASETNGPLEQKIAELLNAIDPNPDNPVGGSDDADLAAQKWGFWVDGSSNTVLHTDPGMINHTVRAQARRILNSNPVSIYPGANPYANWGDGSTSLLPFLPGRRAFMFANPPPRSNTTPVPPTPPANPTLVIEGIVASPTNTQDQEYFIIRNPNSYAVDISGWQVSGEVSMTFRGGTVIPGQGTATLQPLINGTYVNQLIVAKKPLGFRQRTVSPRPNEYRYVSGPYKGQLSARGGAIVLSKPNNAFDPSAGYTQVATTSYPANPTPSQQSLRISELNYAPAPATAAESAALPGVSASDFEFIEITNAGTIPLILPNARFDKGVEFTFPNDAISTLKPGEMRMIVSNLTAFRLRYGNAYDSIILGEYLGNLNNTGEELQLLDPAGEVVLEFDYLGAWYPGTTATGLSLEAMTTDHTQFGTASGWRPSLKLDGSPGSLSPVIGQQPVGQVLNPGQQIALAVTATGTTVPTYQWRKDGQPIENATSPNYTVLAATEADQGTYDVVVTNEGGSLASAGVVVSVNDPVLITGQPEPRAVNPGTELTLGVIVEGTGPFTYQWRKNDQAIDGATNSTLPLAGNEPDQAEYDVVITNVVGPVVSNKAAVLVNDPVAITGGPTGGTFSAGTPVTLTVTATGTGPFTYQWRKNLQNIDNATGPTLELGPITELQEGTYDVIVDNVVNIPQTSPSATVAVNEAVQITNQPYPVVIAQGGSATFQVAAIGTPVITYQWRKNQVDLEGETGATLHIPSVNSSHLGSYDVVVTNVAGPVTSSAAGLSFVDWNQETGTFQGLLAGPNLLDPAANPRPGRVTAVINKTGKVTGRLEYFGVRHSFAANFNANLEATVIVSRKSAPPVTLHLSLDGAANVLDVETSHSESGGTIESSGALAKIPTRLKTLPPSKMGRYTLLLSPGAGAPVGLEAPGYVTLNVAKTGTATWLGKLPDSTKLKGSASLTADDQLAFYSPLYVPKLPSAGQIAGPLQITGASAIEADIAGPLAWKKPLQSKGTYWPGGLAMLMDAAGGFYQPPPKNQRALSAETLDLELAGPVPGGEIHRSLQLSVQNKFSFSTNAEKLRMTLNKTTGAVSGGFFDAAAGKTRKLEGVLLRREDRAAGFFLSTGAGGAGVVGTWEVAVP